jgi:predicted dehydrogenase
MSQSTRIAIIGAGGIAAVHLAALAKEPRVELKALADISLERARALGEKHGVPLYYADYRDLLTNEEIDAVIVCVPNHLHAPVAIAALEAGKHVLSEKPMAMNAMLAEEMIKVAERSGKVLMIAQNNRFHSESLLLKSWVEQKRLGRVYHIKTGWVRRNGIPGWGSWFTRKELAGGGPLIDVGVHVLDLALWVLGYPKPVSVFGQAYSMFGPHKRKLSGWGEFRPDGVYDVEDLAVALIRFEDGSTLALDASWASHIPEERVYLDLYGEQGGASLDLIHHTVTLFQEGQEGFIDSVYRPPKRDDRLALLQNFIDVIHGRAEPVCRPEQSLLIQHILDAVYRSAETGELVKLGPEVSVAPSLP